jgi:hypothetical protein
MRTTLKYVQTFLIIFGLLGYGSVAFAKKKKKKAEKTEDSDSGEYEANWGMAGCDIWAMIIKDKGRWPQLGVWVLRTYVLNSQTSAITSGTSGCVEGGGSAQINEQRVFFAVNLESLEEQAAAGTGTHLSALSEIFGCEDKSRFAEFSKTNYEKLFNSDVADEVLNNYRTNIKATGDLAEGCVRAG